MGRFFGICVGLCLVIFTITSKAQTRSHTILDPIEGYALAAKPANEVSISALATYLSKAGSKDAEKVRSIYAWVARKVRYDAALFLASAGKINIATRDEMSKDPRFAGQRAEVVLKNRLAVCLGYSRLVEALCKEMGITCWVVNGWAAISPNMAKQLEGQTPNHAWNIVLTDGAWQLLDATWGAGHLDLNNRFEAHYSDSLLFPDPNRFVQQHLPTDPAYQLLQNPKTKKDFFSWNNHLKAKPVTSYVYTDTLSTSIGKPEEEVLYRSSLRSLQFDPTALFARLKVVEYHSTLAFNALQEYQKGIEAYNKQQIPVATPNMLSLLDQAEKNIVVGKRLFLEIPKAQLKQVPAAQENITNMNRNLEMIAKQRAFWKEQ
jgi:hypothetical protein